MKGCSTLSRTFYTLIGMDDHVISVSESVYEQKYCLFEFSYVELFVHLRKENN